MLAKAPPGPGQLSRDEQVLADFIGTPEYFYNQTENGGPSDPDNGLHTNTSWVDSIYAVLDLPFNQTDATNRINALLQSYQPQRAAVVQAFVNSPEYRTRIVTEDIETYLRETPTASQVSYWSGQLQSISREQEIANYLATPTYYNLSPSILGVTGQPTNTTFVEAVFQDVYGSSFSPTGADITFWANQITSGKTSRYQFALTATTGTNNLFLISSATHGVINALYNEFLGRNATPGDITHWMQAYAAGAQDEDVIVYLLQTPEYFYLKHQFP